MYLEEHTKKLVLLNGFDFKAFTPDKPLQQICRTFIENIQT
jgi:hypothetical protein